MTSVAEVEKEIKVYNAANPTRWGTSAFYSNLDASESEVELSIGTAVWVDGGRVDSKYEVQFKIGEDYFEAITDYSSWDGVDWEYVSLHKVEPYEVTVTRWRRIPD